MCSAPSPANREAQGAGRIDLDNISNSEIAHLIDEWIHSERDRKILKRRLIDGICYEPLADEFDMSVRQMKEIVYKAEAKLFKHI